MAHDVAVCVALDGRARRSRRQLSADAARPPRRRAGRHRGSSAAAGGNPDLPVGCRGRAGNSDPALDDDRVGAARFHLRPRRRRGDDDARVGRHRSRSGSGGRDAHRHCAQQHRHQCVAGDRTRDRRRPRGGGGTVAGLRAERAVLCRHPRGVAAVATRAPQEHAAGRALRERDSRRHALCHAHAELASGAHPRERILPVRQCDVVAVPADRAPGARARPGNIRPAAHLHRCRCGRRGHAAAPLAREALARRDRRRRERALCACARRPRPRA